MSNHIPAQASRVSRRAFLGSTTALGLTVAGGGLISACSSSSSPSAAGSAGKARRGGKLVVATGGASTIDTADPFNTDSYACTFMPHVVWDPIATWTTQFQYRLHLAESIEPNSTADVWTVRFRPGIEFHNGKTLSADDAIFTYHYIPSVHGDDIPGGYLHLMDYSGLKKLDALTFQIKLIKPISSFDRMLANTAIVPVGFNAKTNPIGTGPFSIKSFTPNQQWSCKRFANYWNGNGVSELSTTPAPSNLGSKPYVDELVVTVINDDSARINALTSGEVQAINLVPFAETALIRQHPGLELSVSRTGSWTGLYMDMAKPPFNDVRVRQALRLSVDRKLAVQSAVSGFGTTASDLYSPFDPAYNNSLVREQDIAQAKFLLKQAGQEGLSISLVNGPITPDAAAMSTVIANNANQAGFNASVHTTDIATLFGAQYGNWPLATDNYPTYPFLTQAGKTDVRNPAIVETHMNSPEFNALYNEAESTLDQAKSIELQREMQRILFEEGGWLIPYFPDVLNGYSTKTAGWPKDDYEGQSFGRAHFEQVYFVD